MPAKKMKAKAKRKTVKKPGFALHACPTTANPRRPRKRRSSRRRLDRLVRNPDLLISWSEGELFVEDLRSGEVFSVSPETILLLDSFEGPRKPSAVADSLPDYDRRSVLRSIGRFRRPRSADSGTRRPAAALAHQSVETEPRLRPISPGLPRHPLRDEHGRCRSLPAVASRGGASAAADSSAIAARRAGGCRARARSGEGERSSSRSSPLAERSASSPARRFVSRIWPRSCAGRGAGRAGSTPESSGACR